MTLQPPPKTGSRFQPRHIIWALVALIGLVTTITAIGLVSVFALGKPVRIQGQAMMPTFHDGDKVLMKRKPGSIDRGDIVIFYFPLDPSKSYIKRVIGLPGETVMIEDGKISINGKQVEEPYLNAEYLSHDALPAPMKVPDGHYFVLGDNRRNSSDSRYWGMVPRKAIYGKYWFRYWKH